MLNKSVTIIVFIIGALLMSSSSRLFGQASGRTLVGTWNLISWASTSGADVSYPFGNTPTGVLTYDSNGRMSAQLMRPGRPLFKSGDLFGGSTDEIKAAFEGFIAYYGTYTIDEKMGTVTHHVQGSSFPNFVGTDLKRSFTVSGRRLTLRTAPRTLASQSGIGTLVWERVE